MRSPHVSGRECFCKYCNLVSSQLTHEIHIVFWFDCEVISTDVFIKMIDRRGLLQLVAH
ncbi:hypothetical protein Plhal304r1_c020g0072151 [Plasmopara halstedii]